MEKEFIPYQEALALKELGFDEQCFSRFYTKPKSKMFGIDEKGRYYPMKNTPKKLYIIGEHFVLNNDNIINAPFYHQTFKWFRKEYAIDSYIRANTIIDIPKTYQFNIDDNIDDTWYEIYEEAELACLKKLIEIVNL